MVLVAALILGIYIGESRVPQAKPLETTLADVVRHELSTGELVGGRSHIQKAIERSTNLENIIKKQDLNQNDLDIAKRLLEDIRDALGGR